MALNKSKLEIDIKKLLDDTLNSKEKSNEDFAKKLAGIIHNYIISATVSTTVNSTGVGNTGAPVISQGSGTGKLS